MFEQTPEGPRELKLKVLDMGLGQERIAWFSQATPNMYEAIFPFVLNKLRDITNIKLDHDLYNRFSQFSAYLNIDEVDNIDEAWDRVAKELEIEVLELKNKILPMTGLYSIADHSRSLLFAINDGKLPSNVGGGYNLRVIFRRAISFIDQFNWEIDMADVCKWHAKELIGIFPEVSEHLDEIREILDVEKEKYYATKKKAGKILERELKKGGITANALIELYDSNGISPDMVKEAAKKHGVKVKIPDNFYNLVVEKHEKSEQIHATGKEIKFDLDGIPETKSLYYFDYTETSNNAKVLKIIDNMVILDQSVAYPTSGGQVHDIGKINGQEFNDAFKQGNFIIHVLDEKPKFKVGDTVTIEVDKSWRTQLSQHHTATHIVNAAAREILGNHINQAGAKKTLKNSHLDITHYEQISREKIIQIEKRSNEIVEKAIDLNLSFIPRSDAEQKYGMTIYQGGAVPGKNLRIVEIPGIDVEACGGTHLNNTSETGYIHITKSQKIQDGTVRLTFTAGEATDKLKEKHKEILNKLKEILNVARIQLVGRVTELIEKWKNVNKALKSGKINENDMLLTSSETFEGDVLSEISQILSIKKDDVVSKIKKFYSEWIEGVTKFKQMKNVLNEDYIDKLIDKSRDYNTFKLVVETFENLSQDDLKNLSIRMMKHNKNVISIFLNKTNNGIKILAMEGDKPQELSKLNIGDFIRECVEKFGGKGGGKKDYGQGFISNKNLEINEVKSFILEKLYPA
jgi:alanyl-tRNA synthetase